MTPELKESIYQNVLRGVLWGEEKNEIFKIMRTNGILDEEAEVMFHRARAERIAFLRAEGAREAIKGALSLAAGIGIFYFCWYQLRVVPRLAIGACGLGCIFGFWWLISGIMECILAPTKSGSVHKDG